MMSEDLTIGSSSANSSSSVIYPPETKTLESVTSVSNPDNSIDKPETPDNLDTVTFEEQDKSSSTEGPDSPGQSSTSSPKIPMMIPTYPGDFSATPQSNNGDAGNGDLPLLPQFAVRLTDNVSKNGDVIRYQIRVWKLNKDQQRDQNDAEVIEREYEDFEFLHHTLSTSNRIYGIIIPPLPPKSPVDPKESEKQSQKQLGSGNRNMKGDDFGKEISLLDRYMQQLLHHPVFGRDRHLAEFLEHKNPPIRAKIRRGSILTWGAKTFQAATRKTVTDDEEFFVKEREWASIYGNHIKDACDKMNGMIYSQMRLSNQIAHLSTILGASVGGNQGINRYYNRLNSQFGTCLDKEKSGLDGYIANEEASLANYLTLWTSYMNEENAMLERRNDLVIEADAAAKALTKATLAGKAAKTAAALNLKEDKERDLKASTKMAEVEIRRFHQQRLGEMKESLIAYTEGQIRAARDAKQKLSLCVEKMKSFELPSASESFQGSHSKSSENSKIAEAEQMNIPE